MATWHLTAALPLPAIYLFHSLILVAPVHVILILLVVVVESEAQSCSEEVAGGRGSVRGRPCS